MPELVQDVIVTTVALGAISLIVRRMVGFVKPKAEGESPCGACGATSAGSCATRTEAPAPGTPMPLHLVRPDRPRV